MPKSKRDRNRQPATEAKTRRHARSWVRLLRLFEQFDGLHIVATADGENPTVYHLTAYPKVGSKRVHVTRPDFDLAIAAALGVEPSIQCVRCEAHKPPGLFGVSAAGGSVEGRQPYCLACERSRERSRRVAGRAPTVPGPLPGSGSPRPTDETDTPGPQKPHLPKADRRPDRP